MATFDFTGWTVQTEYPTNSNVIDMGQSYQFVSKPVAPPQRKFTLDFAALRWYLNNDDTVDVATDPTRNLGALDAFYQEHQIWKSFIWVHPTYGSISVRFARPLTIPPAVPGGTGWVEGIQLQFIELP